MKKVKSIKTEIMLVIFFVMLIIVNGTGISILIYLQNSLLREVEARGKGLVINIANNVADYLLIKYDLEVAKILKEATNSKDVRYAMIVDGKGKIIAHNDMLLIKKEIKELLKDVKKTKNGSPICYYMGEEKVIDFSMPVKAKGKINLGVVHLGISYSVITDVLKKVYFNMVLFSLIAFILSFGGAFFLSRTITNPINQLAEGAKIVGSGNLNYQIKLNKENELGMLAETFNKMVEDLKKAHLTELEKVALEKELEIASKLQMSLLKKVFPRLENYTINAFYKPAKEVGGDFYDVISLRDGKFCIFIADVSGKGVPAALVMSLLNGIIPIEINLTSDLIKAIGEINDELLLKGFENIYVTLLSGVLNPENDTLEIVSAGHHETLIYRADKKSVETVCPQGAAIGIFDGEVLKSKLKKEVLKINKGDKFLFFTDGIIDAKSNDGKRFGLEKLKEFFMLNVEDTGDILLNKINKEVNYFSEGTIQTDDIAMIILERKKF